MPVSHASTAAAVPGCPRTEGLTSLMQALGQITDPRSPRGIRHRLVTILAIAVVTVLCGATNVREIADQAADLPQDLLALMRARFDQRLGRYVAPSGPTLHRTICDIDSGHADGLLCAWIRQAAGTTGGALAIDGKTLRGSGVKLFAAVRHGQPAVLAQHQVPDDTTETTQVAALLDQIDDLTEVVITADAAHTSTATAAYLTGRHAHYALTVKGNTPTLLTQVRAALAEVNTVTTPPDHVEEEHTRGKTFRRSLWRADATGVTFPAAAQVYLIRRDVFDSDRARISKQLVYGVTSLTGDLAGPADLAGYARKHWTVENKVHRTRDVIFAEDAHQAYTRGAPRVMAALRNLAISVLTLHGITKIKATLQRLQRNPYQAIALLNLGTP